MSGNPIMDKLLSRSIELESGCWVWTGHCDTCGYGIVAVRGRARRAHRLAYEEVVGPIPPGLVIDHLCRNPACFNPAHLEAVTQRENINRGVSPRGREGRTHCVNGHEYTPENTLHHARGRRCKTCHVGSWTRNYAPRGTPNGAKTHCPRGHEYTPENTERKNGGRFCLTCRRERWGRKGAPQ